MSAPRKLSDQEQSDVDVAKATYERRNGRPLAMPDPDIADVIHRVRGGSRGADRRDAERNPNAEADAIQRELDLKQGTASPQEENMRKGEGVEKVRLIREAFRRKNGIDPRMTDTAILEIVSRVESRPRGNEGTEAAILREIEAAPEQTREGVRPLTESSGGRNFGPGDGPTGPNRQPR